MIDKIIKVLTGILGFIGLICVFIIVIETNGKRAEETAIKTYIYTPTKFEKQSSAPFYFCIKNESDHYIEGTYEIGGISTVRESDKYGYFHLESREVKIIPGKGELPKSSTKTRCNIEEKYNSKEKHEKRKYDKALEYTIVRTEWTEGRKSCFLYIYVKPGVKDEDYIKIAKEIKDNYAVPANVTIARFAPVMIKPTTNDSLAIYRNNHIIKKYDLLFCSDITNTYPTEDERIIIKL